MLNYFKQNNQYTERLINYININIIIMLINKKIHFNRRIHIKIKHILKVLTVTYYIKNDNSDKLITYIISIIIIIIYI